MMSQIDFRKIRAVALTALLATGVTAALDAEKYLDNLN